MEATLTGREAAEALGVYARLGAAGARFDAGTVARHIRSAAGRRLVLRSLTAAVRTVAVRPPARHRLWRPLRHAKALRASRTASGSPGSPGRPQRLTEPRGEA